MKDAEYKKLLTSGTSYGSKSENTNAFSLKNVGIALAILAGIILVFTGIIYGPKIFKGKDEDGIAKFTYHSSLITGTIHMVPITLVDSITQMIRKGKSVQIDFIVENGNDIYQDQFVVGEDIAKKSQTQDRILSFRQQKLPELQRKISAYTTATLQPPFRSFAVAIDLTEGYRGQFFLADYFDPQDIQWLSDPSKQSVLFLFALGYNPIPGYISWQTTSDKIGTIEREAQNFLEPIKKELPSTALLSQIHFIMGQLATYNHSTLVIKSDMFENTKDLSAYRKDKAYEQFVSRNDTYIDMYRKLASAAAEVTIDPEMTGNVTFLLPAQDNAALGTTTGSKSWYNAINYYLLKAYPQITFH